MEEAQEDLDNALKYYPISSDLLALLGRLNIVIEKIPEAEEKLKRSIFLDAGNIRAVLLLTGIYINRGRCPEALELVNDGLVYSNNSPGLLKTKIYCLNELGSGWADIKASYRNYLKVSTNDYLFRLKFIKGLIENRDFTEASREIKKMIDSPIPFSTRIKITVDLQAPDKTPLIVRGRYKAYRLGKGFIEIDGFPKNLEAFVSLRVLPSGGTLRQGQNLEAKIAVNGLGIFVTKVIKIS